MKITLNGWVALTCSRPLEICFFFNVGLLIFFHFYFIDCNETNHAHACFRCYLFGNRLQYVRVEHHDPSSAVISYQVADDLDCATVQKGISNVLSQTAGVINSIRSTDVLSRTFPRPREINVNWQLYLLVTKVRRTV